MGLLNEGPGFERFREFDAQLEPRRLTFCSGSGPPVILLHEINGATPELFRFGWRVAEAGFTVYIPIFFGRPNTDGILSSVTSIVRVCVAKEFAAFAVNQSSPIADWVRKLAGLVKDRHDAGVGVVGLCLTGSFALTAALDDAVLAPVVSEPALPFGIKRAARTSLHLSPEEIACVAKRVRGGLEILAFRFDGDLISPAAQYESLKNAFPCGVIGDGYLKPTRRCAHAVFTADFDSSPGSSTVGALADLLGFLNRKLNPRP